jgi:flavin-dependent dehydrogenase
LKFDVAVIGGGPAGAVAAYHLSRLNIKVVIVERQNDDTVIKVGESLPPAANPVLNRIGIDQKSLEAHFLTSSGIRSAWGSRELIDSDFIRDPYGAGWLLDRLKFNCMLCSQATKAGAELLQPVQVVEVERIDEEWHLKVKKKNKTILIQAKFLVDATGRVSWLAKKLSIKRLRYDRLLAHAVIFNPKEIRKNFERRTVVESVEDGWWYGTPLPNGKKIAVYLTDQGTEASQEARTLDGFLRKLRSCQHISPFVGEEMYETEVLPTLFAANSSCNEKVTGQGWLATGDAASAFDPISGQGILASIFNAEKSSNAIYSWLSGDLEKISHYENHIKEAFDSYRKNLLLTYQSEKRWPDSMFWKTRQTEKVE